MRRPRALKPTEARAGGGEVVPGGRLRAAPVLVAALLVAPVFHAAAARARLQAPDVAEPPSPREPADSAPSPAPKSEPPKSEPPKSEPPKSEPPKSEPPKAEPPKSEPPKAEPPKAEAPKSEAPKADAPPSSAPRAPAAPPVPQVATPTSAPPPPAPSAAPTGPTSVATGAFAGTEDASEDPRLVALNGAIEAAMSRVPRDGRELEQVCLAYVPKKLHDLDPTLDTRLKVCAAHGALALGRVSVARQRLDEALAAARAVPAGRAARRLESDVRRAMADVFVEEARATPRCASALGLRELAAQEARTRAALVEEGLRTYRAAVVADDPAASARVERALADAAAALYRDAAQEKTVSYRGIELPSPLSVERVDAGAVLDARLGSDRAWSREIDRLYGLAEASAARAGEPLLAAEIAAARARHRETAVTREVAVAPFAIPEGALYADGRLTKRRAATGDVVVDRDVALGEAKRLVESGVGDDPRLPFAVALLADHGETVPEATVLALLVKSDPASRLAALRAIERQPAEAYYKPLIALFEEVRTRGEDAFDVRFSTLARALFGAEERTLLALRAVVGHERKLVLQVTFEARLPLDERAFVVVDHADPRALYRLQEMMAMGDDRAAALALYGIYRTSGERVSSLLRPSARGRLGCVSASLAAVTDRDAHRFVPSDDSTSHGD